MGRPVNTQMPKTKIPPATGSGGGPKLIMNLGDLGGTYTKLAPSNNPGPTTAPSAQGPTRAATRQAKRPAKG